MAIKLEHLPMLRVAPRVATFGGMDAIVKPATARGCLHGVAGVRGDSRVVIRGIPRVVVVGANPAHADVDAALVAHEGRAGAARRGGRGIGGDA